jgi:hypothetical protein
MKTLLSPVLSLILVLGSCNQGKILDNGLLEAGFSENGLSSITNMQTGDRINIIHDEFLVIIDGDSIKPGNVETLRIEKNDDSRTFHFKNKDYKIRVVYELKKGWEFISKQVFIVNGSKDIIKIEEVQPFSLDIDNEISGNIDLTGGRYGKLIRYSQTGASSFFLVQNPYTLYNLSGGKLSGKYDADMVWEKSSGEFPSDRACLGLYSLTGNTLRHDLLPEWSYVEDPEQYVNEGIQLDYADINALTDCARSFLLVNPKKAARVHIGWCENDYQVDVATAEGRKEYLRIIDQAAAVGCNNVLYTPNHSVYGPLENNKDAWGWENLLWLGLGQKVRSGEWVPGKDSLPADIKQMIDYAAEKGVKLMAYVYPSLPFMQDSSWTAWRTKAGEKPEHYLTVDTGLKSFQDWFIDMCITFYKQTGISGYSFDHWWIAYEDENGLVSSKYQQWFGTRRILEELRRRAPEIIIDGRQQYHHFGTYTWLAGTYPHPMMSDEQPGSFNPFPDLSTDRISADRQRYIAHRLMVRDFTPIEILPGFITHQTQRSDADREMRRDSYRTKDWDYTGWKYSLISTIGTAPFNLVVNYLPARDETEFRSFSAEDKAFFNKWLDFADENLDVLRNLRPVLGQPMAGRCDGTAAIQDNRGFLFIFNPNYGEKTAEIILDESIGLESGGRFILREIYPLEERNIAHPVKGFFDHGDKVEIPMTGTSALVIRIVPIPEEFGSAVLFNSEGNVETDEERLKIEQVRGQCGKTAEIMVYHPKAETIEGLSINGIEASFETRGKLIKSTILFDGFSFSQELKSDDTYNQSKRDYKFIIPGRIKEQLDQRRKEWPVEYSEDDLLATWTDPSRLLLFINIADPYREEQEEWNDGNQTRTRTLRIPMKKEEVKLEINGMNVPVFEAYNGVYPYVTRTFLGFYADISSLQADVEHELKISLPNDLKPGQFQGLFFHNIEEEYTDRIIPEL